MGKVLADKFQSLADEITQYTIEHGRDGTREPSDSYRYNSGETGCDAFRQDFNVKRIRVLNVNGYTVVVKDNEFKHSGGTWHVYWSEGRTRHLEIFSKEYSKEFLILMASRGLVGKQGEDHYPSVESIRSKSEKTIEPTPWEFNTLSSVEEKQSVKDVAEKVLGEIKKLYGLVEVSDFWKGIERD